jgi:hypothetical protein
VAPFVTFLGEHEWLSVVKAKEYYELTDEEVKMLGKEADSTQTVH